MIRAVPVRILRQALLVVVGAVAFSSTEITQLSRRSHAAGRHSVDVAADPPVDQATVHSKRRPTHSRRSRTAGISTRILFAYLIPCMHSFGSMTPRLLITLKLPFFAWAMYMFIRA